MAEDFSGVEKTIVNLVSEQLAPLAPIAADVQTIKESLDVLDERMKTVEVDANVISEMAEEANLICHPADDVSSGRPEVADDDDKPIIKFDPKANYYDMSGDKHLVIFNHDTYQATKDYDYKAPRARLGSNRDVERIYQVFHKKLGFLRPRFYSNLTREVLMETLDSLRRLDYRRASCLCIIILTHGDAGGKLYAADRRYELKEVIKKFENHPTLVTKPKLFFVQACRGSEVDAGTEAADAGMMDDRIYIMPSHADFLIMRSSVEEYVSFIHTKRGSWLIQDLCTVLDGFHDKMDILAIITLVQRRVAARVSEAPEKIEIHKKKQVPETRFTLTKFLQFTNAAQ